jgi:hypothetical protein
VVIYGVALPLTILGAVGGAAGLAFAPSEPPAYQLPMTLGFAVLAGLLAWRMWLNSRALGWAGAAPGPQRILLVWAPLIALALVGLLVALFGLVWIGLAVFLMQRQDPAPVTDITAVLGVLATVLGCLMIWPVIGLLRRRRSDGGGDQAAPDASPASDAGCADHHPVEQGEDHGADRP